MTDVTGRLDAIQATANNHKKAPGGIYGPGSDVAFLLDLARKQQAALAEVRKLHAPDDDGDCTHCGDFFCDTRKAEYPCPTIRALDGDDA